MMTSAQLIEATGIAIGMGLGLLLGLLISRRITKPIRGIIANLSEGPQQARDATRHVSTTSEHRDEDAARHVSGLLEAVSLLEEARGPGEAERQRCPRGERNCEGGIPDRDGVESGRTV